MTKTQALVHRVANWFHGARWPPSNGGDDPDEARRDEADRMEFVRRQAQVRARLERLESILDVKTARKRDE